MFLLVFVLLVVGVVVSCNMACTMPLFCFVLFHLLFQDGVKKTISSASVRSNAGNASQLLTRPSDAAQQTTTTASHSAQTASGQGSMTGQTLVSFASLSAISGTSLTLFSKFFASFPHGTFSLSVSHQYLALDGIYHPIRAAIPNNSTR